MRLKPEIMADLFSKETEKALRPGSWVVCEIYEYHDGPQGRYIQAPPQIATAARVEPEEWEYQPLLKHSDLFLRFARLADDGGLDKNPELEEPYGFRRVPKDGGSDEDPGPQEPYMVLTRLGGKGLDTDKNARVAKEWAEDYGVLGLSLVKLPDNHDLWANPRGGKGDTVVAFASEAWTANTALKLYEAATARGGPDVEAILRFVRQPALRRILSRDPAEARKWALGWVADTVKERMRAYCYPENYQRTDDTEGTDSTHVEGYGIINLLGAIWLQAHWLLTRHQPWRCRRPGCSNVVSIEGPQPPTENKKGARGKYRTRNDKEYCSKECANRHYYEREIKPRRQAHRARRADDN